MKITVFTITDCYFCKQEKDYLKNNNLQFEEKNLEENRDWLTEMLTISNNFAGTPVTKIEKDDGTIVVLKGFTKEEFDETLGIKAEAAKPEAKAPVAPVQEVKPVVEEPKVEVQAPAAPPVEQPVTVAPATPAAAAPDAAAIAAQIEELKKLQEALMNKPQAVAQAPVVSAPVQQVAQAPVVQAAPVVAAPAVAAPAPTQNAVDDSLAAILAELQAKINSANSGGTQGQQS